MDYNHVENEKRKGSDIIAKREGYTKLSLDIPELYAMPCQKYYRSKIDITFKRVSI